MSALQKSKNPLGNRDLDLDVVRGLAILLAMGWHFNGVRTSSPIIEVILTPSREFGWAGVDLFFVLSGFLVGSLVLKEADRTGNFRAGRFMIRRILKLWPVLYVYLAVQVAIGPHGWRDYLLQNIFHVQNFAESSLAQMWSLAVEEHFYLAVVLFYPVFVRRGGRPSTLIMILLGLLVTAIGLRIVAVCMGVGPIMVQHQTQFRVDSLAFGVLLAVISVHYSNTFGRHVEGTIALGFPARLRNNVSMSGTERLHSGNDSWIYGLVFDGCVIDSSSS